MKASLFFYQRFGSFIPFINVGNLIFKINNCELLQVQMSNNFKREDLQKNYKHIIKQRTTWEPFKFHKNYLFMNSLRTRCTPEDESDQFFQNFFQNFSDYAVLNYHSVSDKFDEKQQKRCLLQELLKMKRKKHAAEDSLKRKKNHTEVGKKSKNSNEKIKRTKKLLREKTQKKIYLGKKSQTDLLYFQRENSQRNMPKTIKKSESTKILPIQSKFNKEYGIKKESKQKTRSSYFKLEKTKAKNNRRLGNQ